MKNFFEEYGFVILAAIVVILLIAMASPIGSLIKVQISNVIVSFGNATEMKLNAVGNAIDIRVSRKENKIILEWNANKKEDKFTYQYRASNISKEAEWTNKEDVAMNEKQRTITIAKDSNGEDLKNKTKIEFKIFDSNDELVASGTVDSKVSNSTSTPSTGGEGSDIGSEPGTSDPVTPDPGPTILASGTVIEVKGHRYTVVKYVDGYGHMLFSHDRIDTMEFNPSATNTYYENSDYASVINDYADDLHSIFESTIYDQEVIQNYNSSLRSAGYYQAYLPSYEELLLAAGGESNLYTFASSILISEWDEIALRDSLTGVIKVILKDRDSWESVNNPVSLRPVFVVDTLPEGYTIIS